MLVVIGAVTAGRAVVSGSIVVVGNVVYWMERRGKCPARHLDFKIVTASAFLFLFPNDGDVSQSARETKR